MATPPRHALILCPLAAEAAAARAAVAKASLSEVDVVTTGVGGAGVRRALAGALAAGPPALVVLFGCAGGLAPLPARHAVAGVVDESGRAWAAPVSLCHAGAGFEPVGVVGVDRLVPGVDGKRRLRLASAAHLVDMESHALAAACTEAGVAWAVVRGVSDPHDRALPPEVAAWPRPDGRLRYGRVVRDILRRPGLMAELWDLAPRAGEALEGAGKDLAALLRWSRENAGAGAAPR